MTFNHTQVDLTHIAGREISQFEIDQNTYGNSPVIPVRVVNGSRFG